MRSQHSALGSRQIFAEYAIKDIVGTPVLLVLSECAKGEQSNDQLTERSNHSDQISPGSSSHLSPNRKSVPVNGSPLSSTFESVSQSSRGLRYLSPSVLERGVSKPGVSRPLPAEDIFLESSTTSRKRALVNDQRPASVIDVYSIRDNPKRSRREQFAYSMLDEEEARKLPVMRGSTVPSERWAPMHSCAAPPLVKSSASVPSRIQLLSSSMASQRKPYWRDITRTFHEKQQSTDSKETHDKPASSSIHPLFDMEKNGCSASGSCSKTAQKSGDEVPAKSLKPHMPNIKGSDGKSISCNVFNASKLIDGEMTGDSADQTNDLPLFAPPIKAAPSAGFLDDMVFTFGAPVERLPGQSVIDQTVTEECGRSGSEGSESSGDDSDNEQSSSTSDAEEPAEHDKEQKPSRPPTAADSETSGAMSSNNTPVSSKEVSPQTKAETSWSCPDCFITNKNVSICAACGHNKDAPTTSKTLVSNISSIGKPSASGFKFGFGTEGAKASSGPSNTTSVSSSCANSLSEPTVSIATSESKQDPSKGSATDSSSTQAGAPKASGAATNRVAWECPDCMVQNKESDDKCVCCGHVMYKSDDAPSKESTSVFVSFGFGAPSSATATSGAAPAVKFGFGASEKPVIAQQEPKTVANSTETSSASAVVSSSAFSTAPAKEISITKTTSTPAFESTIGKADQTKPSQPPSFSLGAGAAIFGAGAKPPLFGSSSSSLFNTSHSTGSLLTASSSTAPAPTTTSASDSRAASTTAPTPFVFGATTNGSKPLNVFESKKDENSTKAPLFGSGLTFGNGPTTTEQVSSASGILGTSSNTQTNTVATGNSLTGSSSGPSLFGASLTAKPLFSTFGNTSDSKPFAANVGGSTENFKPAPFGGALPGSGETLKAPLFGASTNSLNKPLFGSNAATAAPATNGGLSFNFGSSSNAFGAFNTANPSASSISSLPSTSSAPSVFGSVSNVADTSKPFQFGTTIPEPTFQFGQTNAFSGSTPFQFGSSQPSAPAAPTFQIPGITAPAAPSSNFSFTSSGTRKMVAARRRLPQRK
ncbi:unnamed protein product [Haemonchus placei]|uniref:RanBP2-type domain-containing protein n=1 Tax=Haemonchus placei TaxID=6290 RepID=A0A158QL27_HAEPC|nr:unnamed protein product [Haemonchus placei]